VRPIAATTLAWFCALLGWTVLLCFYELDDGAGFEPTDCWVAQTAREMQEGTRWTDLVVPRFCGEKRMQKSPGAYWAVLLVSWLRGGAPVDEAATRVPNAIAAVILVAAIFWFTRRVATERAALFAGFAAASSALILYWSHRGASDLGLAACIAVSLFALWVAAEQQPPGRKRTALWLLGYFAAGVGMLYKLPMPLVCVGLPVFLYVLLRRRWGVLRQRVHLAGLAVFLLTWVPWAIAVNVAEPTAWMKWKVEYLDRFTGALPNTDEQPASAWQYLLYFLPVLVYTLPYTLSLPGAFVRGFQRASGTDRRGVLFLIVWFASHFIFFTVSAGKEFRYILPALPPLFVLLGIDLAWLFDPQRAARLSRRRAAAILVPLLLALGLAGGCYGLYRWYELLGQYQGSAWPEVWRPYAVVAAILLAGAIAGTWLFARRRTHASFAVLVATMWLTWLWAWPQLAPAVVSQAAYRDFAAQLRAHIPPGDVPLIRQIAQQDPRVIWYSDYRFPRVIDQLELLADQRGSRSLEYEYQRVAEEVVSLLQSPERVLFVASLQHLAEFEAVAPLWLKQEGRALPPVHIWLRSRLGREHEQTVLFGNRPPPWPEPEFELTQRQRERIVERARKRFPQLLAATADSPPAASVTPPDYSDSPASTAPVDRR